ncbi:MAG: hypothetical protein GEV04_19090 [Actinophytocola sp.]|nr:hypothetical protein [Actinophytocola sp.]
MIRSYLVECYWPGVTTATYAATVDRVAATALPADRGVRFLDSLLVPVDEVVFYRFSGQSRTDVEWACTAAELPFQRILEYVTAAPTPHPA